MTRNTVLATLKQAVKSGKNLIKFLKLQGKRMLGNKEVQFDNNLLNMRKDDRRQNV